MLESLKKSLLHQSCRTYRSVFLKRPVFIAVTGSCGKTTTKELIAAILSKRYRGRANPGNCNTPYHVARTVLRTSPRDDFCVVEVAAAHRTRLPMELPLSMIKPTIGVVTNIGTDHISLFGSIDAIAAEKSKLVSALPSSGTAVLNADDPRALAMRDACAGRVVTFGLSPEATLRAEDIRSDWPNRLSFTAVGADQAVKVETQLCGVHWVHDILAAMAVGQVMGAPLSVAAEALQSVPPIRGRMSPLMTPDGVTFVRDDLKAPLWTITASLDFVRRATAARKVVVIGTISDFPGNPARKYPRVARQALEAADHVMFVGRNASKCLPARRHCNDKTLQAFVTVEQISKFLRSFLRDGDLVLLKGSEGDNLERIISTWVSRPEATLSQNRDERHVMDVVGVNGAASAMSANGSQPARPARQVIIGLGNPGRQFHNTPHNVGDRIVERLARRFQATWSQEDGASVAPVEYRNQPVFLIRPNTPVNDTGPLLAKLAPRLQFGPENCIVVFDDFDLEFGVVRQRMHGSAGGHRGMQSIISSFESERIRRVKIGVGQPGSQKSLNDCVLTPFGADQLEALDRACDKAEQRILDMIAKQVDQTNGLSHSAP
jgi:aminoacyl-tRNA hydrolase